MKVLVKIIFNTFLAKINYGKKVKESAKKIISQEILNKNFGINYENLNLYEKRCIWSIFVENCELLYSRDSNINYL